jgi:hypothetical protein
MNSRGHAFASPWSCDSYGVTGAMDAIAPVIRAGPADDAGAAVRLTARCKACKHRGEPRPESMAADAPRTLRFSALLERPRRRSASGSLRSRLVVVTPTPTVLEAARLQAAGDLGEDRAEIGADRPHDDHRGNGNQCCDQTVFDRRDPIFVFDHAAQGQ